MAPIAVKNLVRKNTYITKEQNKLLEELAKEKGKSVSSVLREIINYGILWAGKGEYTEAIKIPEKNN